MAPSQDATPNNEDELLRDIETMLRERLLNDPADIDAHLRLARLLAKIGNRDELLEEAGHVIELIGDDAEHPALAQLQQLAEQSGVELGLRSRTSATQRRLGEDPDSRAYFERLNEVFSTLGDLKELRAEFDRNLMRNYNRPSSLVHLRRYSEKVGGAQIALKREDLMGSSSKLYIAVAGQCLLAKRLGCASVVFGGAQQLTALLMATAAARLGLQALVYLPDNRTQRNSPYVLKMRCVGARVEFSDKQPPRDLALDFCCRAPDKHFLILGVDAAPQPFPRLQQLMVGAIGREVSVQAQNHFKRQPDLLVCRGSTTADAVGFLDPFLRAQNTRMLCVEAGETLDLKRVLEDDPFGTRGVVELDDSSEFIAGALIEGSEFTSVRREHAAYRDSGRVEYVKGNIRDALPAARGLASYEGLICPVQTAYAVGRAAREAKGMPPDALVVVNFVEAEGTDLEEVAHALEDEA